MKGYLFLIIAIVFEVFGTTMLKLSNGFTNLIPTLCFILGFSLAFYYLSLSLKTIALSLAYAIWSGLGTALTALIGIFIWNEPFGSLTAIGLIAIIGGVILLNMAPTKETTSHRSSG
ncbi:DMT family transporter [Cerasibacillus sp. JNUCC 74]